MCLWSCTTSYFISMKCINLLSEMFLAVRNEQSFIPTSLCRDLKTSILFDCFDFTTFTSLFWFPLTALINLLSILSSQVFSEKSFDKLTVWNLSSTKQQVGKLVRHLAAIYFPEVLVKTKRRVNIGLICQLDGDTTPNYCKCCWLHFFTMAQCLCILSLAPHKMIVIGLTLEGPEFHSDWKGWVVILTARFQTIISQDKYPI